MSDETIVDPITGECISLDDADALIQSYARIDAADKRLYGAKLRIREAIARLATGTAKTRRVRGKECECVVEMPDSVWDQSILKELWNSYPNMATDYLRIGTIEVRKREYNKMTATSGPKDFETFKKILVSAEKPATALPRIVVESAGKMTEETPKASEESNIW